MTCESCGAADPELTPVHRKYVDVARWDEVRGERVLDEIEHWCFACLTQYPHEPTDA